MGTAVEQPVVLTIAGSDSSGGAGIQADLKTFAANGCYGASVITALTAQNTLGVQGVHPCPAEFVAKQINSVIDDLDVRAIKTGMLYDLEVAKAVFETLKAHPSASLRRRPIICDPVCVSTSGHALLHPSALDYLMSDVFPIAALITPNKAEAELLLAQMASASSNGEQPMKITSLEDMLTAAEQLLKFGSSAVLLKGGHLSATMEDVDAVHVKHPEVKVVKQSLHGDNMEILLAGNSGQYSYDVSELVVDVLHELRGGSRTMFIRPRVKSSSTHGTGCTLSSAIACEVAMGYNIEAAVAKAVTYTHLGIEAAHPIGNGHGPLNHLHSMSPLAIPRRTPTNPYPFTRMLIQSTSQIWKEYVEHDFVRELGKGTLNRASFMHFIQQDYIYLKYYARAYGLLAAKSTSFTTIQSSTQTILNILHEINTHKSFCATFGITDLELENTSEATATTAYGAYLIDTGLQGDSSKLVMALMACLLGYGEVGLWLKKESTLENSWVVLDGPGDENPYKQWIEDYSGELYQNAVRAGLETIEALAIADPPSPARLKEWIGVWERCTRLEKGFWDMAMEASKG
ncbi:thiamine biosynthesis protein [Crassisporium funariophilum]|nr:thiamine biosynthesis protein [Crassisporium funariophilum]